MNKLSIRDLEMSGKRVFMRVDFNVPLDGARVTDDTRIRETLPTIEFARKRGARLVLASHLGRPKGKPDPKYSMKPVAAKLAELLGVAVDFAADCVGADAEAKSRALANGGVLLLENVRYHAEEEANDENFSRQLAALCDGLFVCDAFGSAHRAHASVVGITRFVKQAAAGLLMERELAYLGKALSNPERPFVAVLGGAKVSDKIEVVENLMRVADAMLIGGGMAYTFLKSQGLPVGNSLVEADKLDLARKLLAEAKQRNFRLLLPTDHVLGAAIQAGHGDANDERHRHARWLDGARHRAGYHREIFRGACARENNCVERPDGRVRDAGVRQGHAGNRARGRGGDCQGRHVHRWRRRFRRRDSRGRTCRQSFPHLDGRRRVARIFGRQKIAGRGSADRQTVRIHLTQRTQRAQRR